MKITLPTLLIDNSQKWLLIALGVIVTAGVLGSAWSRDTAITIQILGFCGLITASLLNQLQIIRNGQQATLQAEALAQETKEVKDTLRETTSRGQEKTEELVSMVKETKQLVNSASLTQLRINQRSAKRLSELLPNDPEVAKDLEAANKMVEDHEKAQASATAEKNEKSEGTSVRVTVVNPEAIQVEDKFHQEKPK